MSGCSGYPTQISKDEAASANVAFLFYRLNIMFMIFIACLLFVSFETVYAEALGRPTRRCSARRHSFSDNRLLLVCTTLSRTSLALWWSSLRCFTLSGWYRQWLEWASICRCVSSSLSAFSTLPWWALSVECPSHECDFLSLWALRRYKSA